MIFNFALERTIQTYKKIHQEQMELNGTKQRMSVLIIIKKKTKIRGLSLQVNYTDRATTACRRS
jgi:hypothetical protein